MQKLVLLFQLLLLGFGLHFAQADDFSPFITRLSGDRAHWEMREVLNPYATPLAPLTRVVVLEENEVTQKIFVAVTIRADLHLGYLPIQAIHKTNAPLSGEEQWSAFLSDARIILSLARAPSPMQKFTPDFYRLVQKLTRKIEELENRKDSLSLIKWQSLVKKMNRVWKASPADKPETLARYHHFIFETLNPRNPFGTLSEHTVFVPLSVEWFQSDALLQKYFDLNWIHGNFDMKLTGNSGEGLSRSLTDANFENMASRFFELQKWIAQYDPARSQDPEYQWLVEFSKVKLANIDRFIFVHNQTWNTGLKHQVWQDFIPVDQSFGSLQNPALFSVLIHEVNVNSSNPYFLPGDTHLLPEDSLARWVKLRQQKFWVPPANEKDRADEISKIMEISPLLGTITLGTILNQLD